MVFYGIGLRLTGGFGTGMDPNANIIERRPREHRSDSSPQRRRLRREGSNPHDPGNPNHVNGEDGEGDSELDDFQHAMQNDYSAQNGGANPEGSEDGAATEEDEIMKDYPLPGLMDELEKNVKDLRMDNTKLRSNLETLQLKCEQLERTLQAQQEIHELASENYGKEVQRLRSRREDYKKSLDIIQAKLIWDYYATKFPEEGPRLKDCHRKGEWLPNDQIIDELLQDFVILGSRNAELLTENEKLRINLDTIQKSALSNVERFQPTQDDELTEHFNGLASAIKLLTRDIPATIDPDTLAEMFGSWTLLRGVSASFWKTKLHMRCLLEAAIWSLLMDTVFSTPFYIFGGEHAQACMTQWMELFARRDTLDAASDSGAILWPAPSPLCEKWRYVTIDQLSTKAIASAHSEPIDTVIEASYQDARTGTEKMLSHDILSIAPAVKPLKLQRIIKKAWDLSVEMGKQRCRLQLVRPALEEKYVAGESTNLMGISGCEIIERGRVAFIANPGLRKWGDGHGANLEEYFDLKPALVYIEGE